MMRLGVTLPADPFQNPHLAEFVRDVDRMGYKEAWSFESFGTEAFSPLAATAMLSPKMRLGTAIVPVFTRPPALIAMSAMTVQQLSGGRFVLGLGTSTPTIMEQWMGRPYEHPLTLMRETVAALRAIFKREKVTMAGKLVRINGFRLDIPFDQPPPIYLAAQGERMLRVVGEIADGLITNFITPAALPAMLDHVREGARKANRPALETPDVVCRIMCAVDEDPAVARELLRRALTAYLTVDQYNNFFREIGYEDVADQALKAWRAGDRKQATAAIPDQMVDAIFVFGPVEKCVDRLREYERAGVTASALQLSAFAQTPQERRAKIMRALEKIAARW